MKPADHYEEDLASIRKMMEQSSKFLSLSGLSGILAGTYALLGAVAAYYLVQYPLAPTDYRQESVGGTNLPALVGIALAVLAASLGTGYWLSKRKAEKAGQPVWNETSRRLMINLAIPLATGGLFTVLLLLNGHYGVVAPSLLIFYGLALINASPNLYGEIRYLGYSEILLGLVAALLPGFGLLFWALGFGVLHIFYGAVMYRKYDR
jgi:hypothetical protein